MTKIDRRRPSGPQIFQELRTAIVTSRIEAGRPLSENEVANRLNVSRTPVREAFIKLAALGLLEVFPQRGTFVTRISPAAVRNAQFVREALEIATVRAACRAPAPELTKRLFDLIEKQTAAAEDEDFDRFLINDEAFHSAIADAVGCPRAWEIIENEKAHMDRVRYLSLPGTSPMPHLIAQHEAVARGIEAADFPAAEAAMRVHLNEILATLTKLTAERPELFLLDEA